MPASKKPDEGRSFSVSEYVTVSLSSGRVVDGIVKAVINRMDGVRLQVDFGRDETALVYLWQVRPMDSKCLIAPSRSREKNASSNRSRES